MWVVAIESGVCMFVWEWVCGYGCGCGCECGCAGFEAGMCFIQSTI